MLGNELRDAINELIGVYAKIIGAPLTEAVASVILWNKDLEPEDVWKVAGILEREVYKELKDGQGETDKEI